MKLVLRMGVENKTGYLLVKKFVAWESSNRRISEDKENGRFGKVGGRRRIYIRSCSQVAVMRGGINSIN